MGSINCPVSIWAFVINERLNKKAAHKGSASLRLSNTELRQKTRNLCKKITGVVAEYDKDLWGIPDDYIVVHSRGDARVVFRDGSAIKN